MTTQFKILDFSGPKPRETGPFEVIHEQEGPVTILSYFHAGQSMPVARVELMEKDGVLNWSASYKDVVSEKGGYKSVKGRGMVDIMNMLKRTTSFANPYSPVSIPRIKNDPGPGFW